MTQDMERAANAIQQEMALFTGTLATKSGKAAFFALRALLDPSPEVVDALAKAICGDSDKVWATRNHDFKSGMAIEAISVWRAGIYAILGE